MEVTIAIFGGVCFTLSVFLALHLKLVKKKSLEMLDWFLMSLAAFNGIGFGFVMWAAYEGKNNSYDFSYIIMNYGSPLILIYFVFNLVLIFSIFCGWYLSSAFFNSPKSKKTVIIPYLDYDFLRTTVFVSWLMLIISIIAYWLYTRAYGGFIGFLAYSRAIRSGVFSVENRFSFFQTFGSFAFFSSFVFYSILIDREQRTKKTKLVFWGFIISFSFSLYVLYSWVGRVSLTIYIATFLLGRIFYSNKTAVAFVGKISFFSISALLLLVFTDIILGRSGGNMGIVELFATELSFPLATFYHVVDTSQCRWFFDLLVAPLYILPAKFWSGMLHIETASSLNTFLVLGARKGEAEIFGEIPIDMLSFSFMQGNVFGILIVGLLWGALLYMVQILINKIPARGFRSIINAHIILNLCILSVLYGDPQHIIVRNFHLIVGLLMLWFFSKLFRKKTAADQMNPAQ